MARLPVVAARLSFALLLSLSLSSPLLAQRSDRAVIGGVVSDSQGSAIPSATVNVRNEATGGGTHLVTHSAGAYTTPPPGLGHHTRAVKLTRLQKSLGPG